MPRSYVSVSTANEWGIPVFIGTFVFGAVAHESDIPLGKLPREITLTISTYTVRFAEVKHHGGFWGWLFWGVMDRRRLTVKEVIRELFKDRDSEEEPDGSDNDSESSFVPETVPEEENSDSDGGDADRPSCSYLLKKFLYHPY